MNCNKCKKELTEKEATPFRLAGSDWGICDKCMDAWVDHCFEMDFSMPAYGPGRSGSGRKARGETWVERQLKQANRREAA